MEPSAPLVPDNASDDAEPALDGTDKQLSQDFTEALGFIKSSIAKMDRLITAILNLTREGRREFQPVPIDTRELIEGIVSTVAHQAAEANAQIRIEPLPEIVSDRLALEQIFSNLIDNALKYLKPGVPGDITCPGPDQARLCDFRNRRQWHGASTPRITSGFLTFSAAPVHRTGPDRESGSPMSGPWCGGSVEPCRLRRNFTTAAHSR